MFRISYIDTKTGEFSQKGDFKGVKDAMQWLKEQSDIIPLKLLVFNDYIDAYSKVYDL